MNCGTGHPIVNLQVLKNRNFAAGVLLMTVLGAVLYGTTAALPIFLQTLMGYSALQSGLTLSPRGLGAFVTTFLVGRLVGRVRNRVLITIGFSLLAASSFWLGHINLQISMRNVILPSVLNGIAISFIFTPLTTAAMGYLRQEQMANATGIFNLMRNLGGSFGIAFVSTIIVRRAQVHQALMVGHLTPFDPVYSGAVGGGHQGPHAAERSGAGPDAGARSDLQHAAGPVVAVGFRRELPDVRVSVPAVPAAGLAVQAGEARPGRGGGALRRTTDGHRWAQMPASGRSW